MYMAHMDESWHTWMGRGTHITSSMRVRFHLNEA